MASVICPSCGKHNVDGAKECIHCGADLANKKNNKRRILVYMGYVLFIVVAIIIIVLLYNNYVSKKEAQENQVRTAFNGMWVIKDTKINGDIEIGIHIDKGIIQEKMVVERNNDVFVYADDISSIDYDNYTITCRRGLSESIYTYLPESQELVVKDINREIVFIKVSDEEEWWDVTPTGSYTPSEPVEDKEQRCWYCSKVIVNSSGTVIHATHDALDMYICDYCGKTNVVKDK